MTQNRSDDALARALTPSSVVIIGASDNPDKVGGRPLDYLKRFGYRGKVFPVNPTRKQVQGTQCYPSVESLPEVPDLAIVAVGSKAVRDAVIACARKGVPAAIILSSGFGEAGKEGLADQQALVKEASEHGMRLIGPNAQGLANFSIGAVSNFSTMFTQVPAKDGPVAIVSQSGATSAVLYTLLREQNVGVRYVLATGNEADVCVADLTMQVAKDPAIELIILYTESIGDSASLSNALRLAHQNGIPVIALKAGRTPSGAAAAQSHTGALVNEDAVVQAFFEKHAVWRASDPREAVDAVPFYLKNNDPLPSTGGLVVISNSGSSCVMCADESEENSLPLAQLSQETRQRIGRELASFAAVNNPIDLTAGLMSDSSLLGAVLSHLRDDDAVSSVLISLPVAGNGYDLERIAKDVAQFEKCSGKAVVISSTLSSALAPFQAQALTTFTSEKAAIRALSQYRRHTQQLTKTVPVPSDITPINLPKGDNQFLSELESLQTIEQTGMQCAPYAHCLTLEQAINARKQLGTTVVLKACSELLPHKSEHGLVFLGLKDDDAIRSAFETCYERVQSLGVPWGGVIVATQISARREIAIGAKVDPVFGPIIMVSDGGKYIEAMPDFALLLAPFDRASVEDALSKLRIAPLFSGVRGEPPMDRAALCNLVMQLGLFIQACHTQVASIDLNPVMVGTDGDGVFVVDALIERQSPSTQSAHQQSTPLEQP